MNRTAKSANDAEQRDFHGAAVVDEQGNEVAITEEMVRRAINELDSHLFPEYSASSSDEKTQFSRN